MYRVFLDESGTNPETPVLAVAGCYGEEDQWHEFRRMWIPHAKDFHAKNRSSKFQILSHAMKASGIKSVLISVGKENYKQFATPQLQTALGNSYACCALSCVTHICTAVESKKASFIFESGQPNLSFIMNLMQTMIDTEGWCISSVLSATKSDFIELQTADFVSHICSSYDKPWMEHLFDLGILEHGHLTQVILEQLSIQVKNLYKKARILRRDAIL